jgi:PAS domain S-box-containing protein
MRAESSLVRYRGAVLSLVAILAIFLVITVVVVVLHEGDMLAEERQQSIHELDLIDTLLREALLKHDYQTVEEFLSQWGKGQNDVVEVRATAPNGFVLVDYRRVEPSEHTFSIKRTLASDGRELITLEVVKDFTAVRMSLYKLGAMLIAGAAAMALLLGVSLWFSLRRLALAPLEAEISLRTGAEAELKRVRDKLEERVAERTEELQQQMEAAQRYLDVAGVMFLVIDKGQRVHLVNKRGCQLLEYSEGEVVGKNWFDNFIPERYRKDAKLVHGMLMAEEVEPIKYYESPILTKSGEERIIAWHNAILYDEGGEPYSVLSSGEDITRRREAEEALAYSEDFLRSIIDAEPECVKLIDQDGVVLQMNAAGVAMLEADDARDVPGKSVYPFINPEHRDTFKAFLQAVCKGRPGTLEFEITGVKGTRRWLESHAVPFRDKRDGRMLMLAVTRDITERRRLEGRLHQARKMEAIGTLTGGIAHDFNNILSAIIGFGEGLEMDMPADDQMRPYLEQMLAAADKGTKLTHNLLAFGRKLEVKLIPVKINTIVEGVEKIVRGLIGEVVKLECVYADPELTVMADASQMEQALINLCTNARDSMPQGGTLRISVSEVVIDEHFIRENGFGKPGNYGLLSVTDTGVGMDEVTKQRIFEPFYTTKSPGMGTGLGLSTVYGVVKQHGGYIDVRSEVGRGSSFNIYLPVVKLWERAEAAVPTTPLKGGTETILVAEDDAAVRKITKDVLEKFGYTVLEAEDGQKAVEVFTSHKDDIDLLLLDVVMPNKNGREAYEEIRGMSPEVKALFTSGHVSEVVNKEVIGHGLEFISKPASPRQIIRKVREILDKGA